MNEKQREAVETTEGPVLVLAGAGSGKTRVLTRRVANLIESGKAKPWEILSITFTNKAAAEMKERIAAQLSFDIRDMWVSTFHAMCVRILRRYADRLGYTSSFLIYDTSDSRRVIKRVLEELNIQDNKVYGDKYMKNLISRYKNESPNMSFLEFALEINPYIEDYAQQIFDGYENSLKRQNALDFDDLLLNVLKLFREEEDALEYYRNKFHYILVDEYQDTNMVQYHLVKLLTGKNNNIFVVGDDDQSIYAFRGASIRNILEFEKDFPGAKVIRLEQNYRSDKRILEVANHIISKNGSRKGKTLWSQIDDGSAPVECMAVNGEDEATRIAMDIKQTVTQTDIEYKDIAILYRTHSISRQLEEKLRIYSIPYRVYGGTSFYERKEIKDIIAYLNIIVNPGADTQLLRILNVPKRGIGDMKISALLDAANAYGVSVMEVIKNADVFLGDAALKKKTAEFMSVYEAISNNYENMSLSEIVERAYTVTGYKKMLTDEGDAESIARMENIEEFINSAYSFENNEEDSSLESFLQNISLYTDIDAMDENGGVTLMTMHAAKGLEFDVVYIAGMDEGIFPTKRAVDENNVEEERRLCYVAVTRAKKKLYMIYTRERMLYGRTNPSVKSRFLDEAEEGPLINITPAKASEFKIEIKKPYFSGGEKSVKIKPHKVSEKFYEGVSVGHKLFGKGIIKSIVGEGDSRIAIVDFERAGQKKMFLAFASLEILN